MRYRIMRVLVMFDLPVVEYKDKREYTKFRKLLIHEGFIMMQQSVYCKMVASSASADLIKTNLRKSSPPKGLVQIVCITEKQYASIEYLVGEIHRKTVDSMEELIVL